MAPSTIHAGYKKMINPMVIRIGDTRLATIVNHSGGFLVRENSTSAPTVVETDAITSPLNEPAKMYVTPEFLGTRETIDMCPNRTCASGLIGEPCLAPSWTPGCTGMDRYLRGVLLWHPGSVA